MGEGEGSTCHALTFIEDVGAVVSGQGLAVVHLATKARAELGAVPDDPQLHALGVQLLHLAVHRLLEEAHQGAHLATGSLPVLGAEGVEGEDVDAGVVAGLHDPPYRPHTGPMTGDPWQVSSLGPAAVAVHDDADMARQLRAGRRRDRGGWGWS